MSFEPVGNGREKRVSVLFLAWGFSIHAQRRIGIFTDDPGFEVTVVSTFAYQFPNAKVVLLSRAKRDTQTKKGEALVLSPLACKISMPFIFLYKIFLEIHDLVMDTRILKKTIRKIHPDLIFLQTLLYPGYLVFFADQSIPVLITFWNGDVTWWAKWTGIERLLKKTIVVRGVRKAAAITVNSKAALEACLNYGKPVEKIHLIRYPGVDRMIFFPREKVSAKNHIGHSSSRIVLWPRGTGEYLNINTLISASENIVKRYPDLHFIVLFPNRNVDTSLLAELRSKGIEQNFYLLEKVEFRDMPYYYSAADVMISLSSNDSLPNTMLEAMACGCPVIMGDIPPIREWVVDGQNGYLCPVKDADKLIECIFKVIEDPKKMNEKFIQENLTLIKREVDRSKMSADIKQLVRNISSKKAETP